MGLKKNNKKKYKNFKNIQSLINKNIKLDKIKVNPFDVIEETKNKLGNFYRNLKKEREKQRKRQEDISLNNHLNISGLWYWMSFYHDFFLVKNYQDHVCLVI